jgi:hypothetical protein
MLTPSTDLGPFTHIAESCARWVNFQSIMARVTAKDMIYCAPFTALGRLTSLTESNAKIYDVDIEGAAQWVMWPLECRHVYVECLKRETTVHYWEPWSKQRWVAWKRAFEAATEKVEHDDRTRRLASRALQQMLEIEIVVDEEESAESSSGSE